MWNPQQQFLNSQLSPGETLLWSGKPKRGIFLRSSDLFVVPFALLWCGFAVFWEFTAWRSGAPLFFLIWGVPFILVGLFMVFGRFIYDASKRSKTYYAVTPERVAIVYGGRNQSVKSLSIKNITDLTLTEHSDGTGSIAFGPTSQASWQRTFPLARRVEPDFPTFERIPAAKNVYEIIRQARKTKD
ncbi:MAG: hypothetical protein ABI878_00450 [Acidobacteriota bacterium]